MRSKIRTKGGLLVVLALAGTASAAQPEGALQAAKPVIVLVATAAAAEPATDVTPDALARSITDEVLAILRADKSFQAGDSRRVLQLVESKVLPHFNFAHMTQLAMGRNWRPATPEQQKALTDEFRTLLVRTYTTAFMLYRNQTIDYRPVRMAAGDTDAVVKSVIKQASGQSVSVDYGMEKVAGAWKVYDVKIESVSLVENYRGTFNTEIQRNGIDGLIKALSTKNQALAAQAVK